METVAALLATLCCTSIAVADVHPDPSQWRGLVPLRSDGRIDVGINDGYPLAHQSGNWQAAIDAETSFDTELGAHYIRQDISWIDYQPDCGAYADAKYDHLIGDYVAAGLRPIIFIGTVPLCMRPADSPARACTNYADCWWGPPEASILPAFDAYVRRVVDRYGASAAAIEVWNEPNFHTFWGNQPFDPETYTMLLSRVYSIVQDWEATTGRSLPVLGGALSTAAQTDANAMAMHEFLSRMYAAGARGHMDAISFHPYPVTTDLTSPAGDFQRAFSEVRDVRDSNESDVPDDERTRLWVTEVGIASSQAGGENQQRDVEIQIYRNLNAMTDAAGVHDVDVIVFHKMFEGLSENGYGMVRAVGQNALGMAGFVKKAVFDGLKAELAG